MDERPDPGPAIEAFWMWWAENLDLLEHEVATAGAEATFITPLSAHVTAIHPDLDWEFGKGHTAQHHLCLSAKGNDRLRVIAERWRAAGPGDNDLFEFHCARQRLAGNPADMGLGFGDVQLPFDQFRFALEQDDTRQRFHIVAHHPVFAEIDEEGRARMLFISLDNILGEDAVETWIGAIEGSADPAPEHAIGPEVLQRLVDGALERWPDRSWAIFRGTHPDTEMPMVLAACASHKYLLDPLFDTLCLVRIPYEVAQDGMPSPQTREWLDTFDDRASDAMGDQIRLLARETGNGARTVWIYLRAENGPERRQIDGLIAEYEDATLTFHWDPGWRRMPV